MAELIFSLLIFLLAVAGMALGILRGRRPISGSCGGLNLLPGITSDCGGACGRQCAGQSGEARKENLEEGR